MYIVPQDCSYYTKAIRRGDLHFYSRGVLSDRRQTWQPMSNQVPVGSPFRFAVESSFICT